jgi:peptidoglycan hydrolase-like protein with peptidoglycan-binding domain
MKTIIITLAALLAFADTAQADHDTCDIQRRLSQLGYFDGPQNCIYGPMTGDAVAKFQRDNGLYVDGIAGEDTKRMLFADREEAVVIQPKAPMVEEPEDVPAQCKSAAIEEIGAARPFQSFAMGSARNNWARKARFQHGELYADPENARIIEQTCTKSTVGGIGITNYRCVYKAFPCRAGN